MTDTHTKQIKNPQLYGFWYFLAGGSIGAALALLFAPKSGVELRTDISDITRKGYEETVDLAHQLKEQSTEAYNSIKEKSGKLYDHAATKWSHFSDAASDLQNDLINGASQLIEDKSIEKKPANRRSTQIM